MILQQKQRRHLHDFLDLQRCYGWTIQNGKIHVGGRFTRLHGSGERALVRVVRGALSGLALLI